MILLETPNRIIADALRARIKLKEEADARAEPLDITFAEFDDVMYHLTSTMDEPNKVTISLALKCFNDLKANGADAVIEKRFGKMVQPTAEEGHDLTLVVDTNDLPSDVDRLVEEVASMKRHVFSGPLEKTFDAVAKGEVPPTVTIQYRPNETMWIVPQKDQVVIIFSIEFRDPSDIPIAKVFLQEFAEARRQAGLGSAPPVSYTYEEVPLELKSMSVQTAPNKSFVSFVVFPRNFEAGKRDGTISMLHQFRDYLHFHIKASKGYMHSRMRASVVSWLKVLRQAVPEHPGGEKEKKTASGKRFVRQ